MLNLSCIHTEKNKLQNCLYDNLNQFSEKNKTCGRLCSIPVSILDVGLVVLYWPLQTIYCVGMAAMNLLGAAFDSECTLKHALLCTESALGSIVHIPITLALAPVKIVFQFFSIIIDPAKVQSISSLEVFKN